MKRWNLVERALILSPSPTLDIPVGELSTGGLESRGRVVR
jgi:hypothetical protein